MLGFLYHGHATVLPTCIHAQSIASGTFISLDIDPQSHGILTVVRSRQANEGTKFHRMNGFFYLGIKINTHRSGGVNPRKFNDEKIKFIVDLLFQHLTSYLDGVRSKKFSEFHMSITVWRIIDEAGQTRKVIERRGIEISVADIIRYYNDLLSLPCG